MFAKNDLSANPVRTSLFDKIDEKFNKSPKSSESSQTSKVLKPTIFSPVLINSKSNGLLSKATSVNGSGEAPQAMQKSNTELVQKLLCIT